MNRVTKPAARSPNSTDSQRAGRLPDFIIAGAPRSGTTWLYELLDRHPQIYMAKPVRPEPKFFLVDELHRQGLNYYSQTWFSDIGDAAVCGEKSTNYLEGPEVAVRIRQALPHVKLVFILREPAERAYSNYLWTRMNGLEAEPFDRAIAAEPERARTLPARLKYARPYAYFSRGLYADQLNPFFAKFSREQIVCLKFEDIRNRPEALCSALHQFLGVSTRPEDAKTLGVVNAAEGNEEPMPIAMKKELQSMYADANRQLAELLGPTFDVWSYS